MMTSKTTDLGGLLLILLVLPSSFAFADEMACGSDNNHPIIATAPNQQPFGNNGYFLYESRAEDFKGNLLPFRCLWCIDNRSGALFEADSVTFHWGTNKERDKFFYGEVKPGAQRPRMLTDGGKPTASPEPLSYGGSTITPQTIYPEAGSSAESSVGSTRAPSSDGAGSSTNGEGPLPVPWESPARLQKLLDERQANLFHEAYGVFDLPASRQVADAIRAGDYRESGKQDFVTVEMELLSEVSPDGKKFYVDTGLEYKPYEMEDLGAVQRALAETGIHLRSADKELFASVARDEEGRLKILPATGKEAIITLHAGVGGAVVENETRIDFVNNEEYSFGGLRVRYFAPK
jgi:hypothetical protein